MDRTFLLTGATGFLGSHLMAALLARGDRVVALGRAAGEAGLRGRVTNLLDWFGLGGCAGRMEAEEADFSRPLCGLPPRRCRDFRPAAFIHCASDTRFSWHNRRESLAANVDSLREVVNLAAEAGASAFHYVSTAYVADPARGLCPEVTLERTSFLNCYEETKWLAEREVTRLCRGSSLPLTIIRPSIVYGDAVTGRATRFTALYHHVRSLLCLRDIYRDDITLRGGNKSRPFGIALRDGTLHLPLRLVLPRRGSLDLVPVDYFVAAVLAVLEKGEGGGIYHVTAGKPQGVEELAAWCERFLGLRGIEVVYGEEEAPANPPEALFNRFIEPYRPYLSDPRVFDRTNTDRVTGDLSVPELTYEVFRRCMAYAVEVDWGRKLPWTSSFAPMKETLQIR